MKQLNYSAANTKQKVSNIFTCANVGKSIEIDHLTIILITCGVHFISSRELLQFTMIKYVSMGGW